MTDEKSYSEKILLRLIEKSLAKMEQLDALCLEMEDDVKVYSLWITCIEKLANVLEKLYKIQNPISKETKDPKQISNSLSIGNAVILTDTTDLMRALEVKYDNIKTKEDLFIEE